uniref:PIN domain-containing protein n=1 Tax=Candidatus Kentrum sp. FW TaxID=2126338 RepID=A0A450SGY7_9GAMM|nr:MAG: PIN domain-containing protein [Candidatus Kentron sp. FW]
MQVAFYYRHPIDHVLALIRKYSRYNLELVDLTDECWLKAEEIARYGNEKSGFPSLYDSVYHALAIENDCSFITADNRHETKAENFGHIVLVENWERAIG